MTAFKKAEDRDSVILRLHNPTGEVQSVSITIGLPVKQAWYNNLNEVRGETLSLDNGCLQLLVPVGKIVTIELE